MNEKSQKLIDNLLLILTEEQKSKDLVEISEEDKIVTEFLEKSGTLSIGYYIEHENQRLPSEREGNLNLWYKDLNQKWIINMFDIKRFLNANWKE